MLAGWCCARVAPYYTQRHLFCLALQPALEQISASLPGGCHVIAYLDDIYLVCDRDQVANVFADVRATLHNICHIDINMGKLAAWSKEEVPCPEDLHAFGHEFWKSDAPLDKRGLKIWGAPPGTREYI